MLVPGRKGIPDVRSASTLIIDMSGIVKGCHLVGSVPLADTEETFKRCIDGLPSRLKRLPDGETGERWYFTLFQASKFKDVPFMLVNYEDNDKLLKNFNNSQEAEERIDRATKQLSDASIETGYDGAALSSYRVFKQLRGEGKIPERVKFQVCLPTYVTLCWFTSAFVDMS